MIKNLTVKTSKPIDFVDLTDQINRLIKESGVTNGVCTVFVKHTTAAIMVGEAESDLFSDIRRLVNLIPKTGFAHAHGDIGHTPAHILSSVIGQSLVIPVANYQLDLGTWQVVLLVELHGPRLRQISVVTLS